MSISIEKPLNINTEDGQNFLKDLQGNILQGHGRDYAMHLFVCFGKPENEQDHSQSLSSVRKWISNMVSSRITTAYDQLNDVNKDKTFMMLLLTSQGYEFLGERRPKDGPFRDGMRERGNRLNDPSFQKWDSSYKHDEKDIHALVIVATKKDEDLTEVKKDLEKGLKSFGGSILVDQRGNQKRDSNNRAIEHFGYADGVSQPNFFDDGRNEAEKYDQRAALKLVLEKDRHGNGGYGSFFVYRVLEQNVNSFDSAVSRVANELGEDADLIGAMAVGRFKNGTPVTTHGEAKLNYDPSKDENFNYDDDIGSRCPLHSHIRKVNPRESLGFITNILAREQKRRIARRGITYTNNENNTVGLLFMCFQSDIKDQFEFIQRRWSNSNNFSERGTGLDPVIGQDGGPQEPNDFPNWPTGYNSSGRKRIHFDEHVKFLGGEYFFAPSISGLIDLGSLD